MDGVNEQVEETIRILRTRLKSMSEPEPKPAEPVTEPIPAKITINNTNSWPAWLSLGATLLLSGLLAYSELRQDVVNPPVPLPTPVIKVEPVVITPEDAIATLDGIRLNAERTKMLVDLVNAGQGTFSLRWQPVGKAELTRTVIVSGDKPAPVKPPIPDEPGPAPPVVPVDPNTKVTAVTFIYEKDSGGIPNHVSTALNKINRESNYTITATIFEDDSTTGGGNVPAQYKAAYEAAKKEGLPVLVVTAGDKVLRSVKAPKTEQEILEAAR